MSEGVSGTLLISSGNTVSAGSNVAPHIGNCTCALHEAKTRSSTGLIRAEVRVSNHGPPRSPARRHCQRQCRPGACRRSRRRSFVVCRAQGSPEPSRFRDMTRATRRGSSARRPISDTYSVASSPVIGANSGYPLAAKTSFVRRLSQTREKSAKFCSGNAGGRDRRKAFFRSNSSSSNLPRDRRCRR